MREAAVRLATDIGAVNQNGCVNARVVYVVSGTDDDGLAAANRFGDYVYEAMLTLPTCVSTKPRRYDPGLREQVEALRLDGDWYHVIGGRDDEGAIIVSQLAEPVEFSTALNDRTANLVPDRHHGRGARRGQRLHADFGIYPESLKDDLKDVIAALRRPAAGVAGLRGRVGGHELRPAGRHRADAAHGQMDRERDRHPRPRPAVVEPVAD